MLAWGGKGPRVLYLGSPSRCDKICAMLRLKPAFFPRMFHLGVKIGPRSSRAMAIPSAKTVLPRSVSFPVPQIMGSCHLSDCGDRSEHSGICSQHLHYYTSECLSVFKELGALGKRIPFGWDVKMRSHFRKCLLSGNFLACSFFVLSISARKFRLLVRKLKRKNAKHVTGVSVSTHFEE